ncbi:MAG TPA: hypothetical protein VGD78_06360 [Chthoniobacterales bacterium]
MAEGQKQERIDLSLQQLAAARKATETVAALLEQKLHGYTEVLRPILLPAHPARSPGMHLGGDKGLSDLKDRYRTFAEKRLNLPKDFEPGWLDELGTKLEFRRWEYSHELETGNQKQVIQITSPARWLVYYGPGLHLAQAAAAFSNREEKNVTSLRQFLVNALAFAALVRRNGGLTALLHALHYRLEVIEYPLLHNLPVVVISAEIPSFLPPDDVIQTAIAFSGVPAFIEVLDLHAIEALRDPFKTDIAQALGVTP